MTWNGDREYLLGFLERIALCDHVQPLRTLYAEASNAGILALTIDTAGTTVEYTLAQRRHDLTAPSA